MRCAAIDHENAGNRLRKFKKQRTGIRSELKVELGNSSGKAGVVPDIAVSNGATEKQKKSCGRSWKMKGNWRMKGR